MWELQVCGGSGGERQEFSYSAFSVKILFFLHLDELCSSSPVLDCCIVGGWKAASTGRKMIYASAFHWMHRWKTQQTQLLRQVPDSKKFLTHVIQYAGLKVYGGFAVEICLVRLDMAVVFQDSTTNWSYAFDLSSFLCALLDVWGFLLYHLEWHYAIEITQKANYSDC